MEAEIDFIILAAGRGSRFGKNPKILVDICGQTCLEWVVSLTTHYPTTIVTNSKIKDKIQSINFCKDVKIALQEEPNGTGDAFRIGLEKLDKTNNVFVLFGDSPLISNETIKKTIKMVKSCDLVFGIFKSNTLNQYGRVYKIGEKYKILEFAEYPETAEFYNAGWMCFNKDFLKKKPELNLNTVESYLTSYVELANALPIIVNEDEAIGINTPEEYYLIKEKVKWNLIKNFIARGVTFLDPSSTHISWDMEIGPGSVIAQNVSIGRRVILGEENKILPYTFIENTKTGHDCTIGPFAYIHNAELANEVKLGAFCEVNRSHIGSKTKAKHLSYIGDAQIGKQVNIGAGTVFCNYDGKSKNQSTVEDGAFLGSNCSYVAPVIIGKGAYIGAGTVVRQNVQGGSLYVANPNYIEYKK